mmetsp:Transcript_38351/g.67663  ORF Transcript_38351/g.67663 Transcript_38351/m.67663 type:complete len:212 (-) Transcript_38351:231-866(-)
MACGDVVSSDVGAGTRADASYVVSPPVSTPAELQGLALVQNTSGAVFEEHDGPGESIVIGIFDCAWHPPVTCGDSNPKSLRSTTSLEGRLAKAVSDAGSSSILSHPIECAARSLARRAALRRPPRVRRRRFRRRPRFEDGDGTRSESSSAGSMSDISVSEASSSISMSPPNFRGDELPCEDPISDKEASVIAVDGVPHDGCEHDFKLMRAV